MQQPFVQTDQRQHQREELHWPVRWTAGNGTQQPGYVCDVSPGGVFIRPTAIGQQIEVQLGQTVELKFQTRIGRDAGETIICKGRIRWYGQHRKTQRSGFGVAFERPSHLALLLGSELQTHGWLQESANASRVDSIPCLPAQNNSREIDLTDMAVMVSGRA